MEQLKIKDYPEKEIVEIEGIRYSYNFFKEFSIGMAKGTKFEFMKRENGVIGLSRLKDNSV